MSRFTNYIKRYLSCRWRLSYLCAIALLLMQTLRVDLSMAFVCMLKARNRTTESVNFTADNQHCSRFHNNSSNQHYEGEFEWSDTLQANMLAGYFYGYIGTNILGGVLADKYGGKRVLGGSLLISSILAILHPSLSRISGYFTLILRVLTGVVSGPIFPSIQSLFGRWAPPNELSSLIGFAFAGQHLGTVVCLSISGYLCVYGFDNGWGSIFYVFGGVSLVFSCVWFYVAFDNPDVHPSISKEERSYLKKTIKSEKVVKKIPWKQLLSSPAVWAINFGWFAHSWTDLSFQVLLPIYVKEALSVNTTSNGLISSAPAVAETIFLPLCGKFADILRLKKYLSTRSVRVLFQTIALIASASLLIAIGLLGCDQTLVITIMLFFSGISLSFSSGGSIVSNGDIAPSYAGIIFGIANAFGTVAGSIGTVSAKAIAPNGSQQEWQIVFAVYAAVCVAGAILFAILAKGEIQDWARIEESDTSNNPKTVNVSVISLQRCT